MKTIDDAFHKRWATLRAEGITKDLAAMIAAILTAAEHIKEDEDDQQT